MILKNFVFLVTLWFVLLQFVVITVCLKAGLETSSWTTVS